MRGSSGLSILSKDIHMGKTWKTIFCLEDDRSTPQPQLAHTAATMEAVFLLLDWSSPHSIHKGLE